MRRTWKSTGRGTRSIPVAIFGSWCGVEQRCKEKLVPGLEPREPQTAIGLSSTWNLRTLRKSARQHGIRSTLAVGQDWHAMLYLPVSTISANESLRWTSQKPMCLRLESKLSRRSLFAATKPLSVLHDGGVWERADPASEQQPMVEEQPRSCSQQHLRDLAAVWIDGDPPNPTKPR
jgi:hypothetical protein